MKFFRRFMPWQYLFVGLMLDAATAPTQNKDLFSSIIGTVGILLILLAIVLKIYNSAKHYEYQPRKKRSPKDW